MELSKRIEPEHAETKKPSAKSPSSRPRPSPTRLEVSSHGQEARQLAAVILEVLAGVRTPTDAAAAVCVSLPRYYALEVRALEGLVRACERRPRGPRRSAEREAAKLRREVGRLEREAARVQALLRVAQRAVGLRAPAPRPKAEPGKKRRKRRPTARAIRTVEILRADPKRALVPQADGKHNLGVES